MVFANLKSVEHAGRTDGERRIFALLVGNLYNYTIDVPKYRINRRGTVQKETSKLFFVCVYIALL